MLLSGLLPGDSVSGETGHCHLLSMERTVDYVHRLPGWKASAEDNPAPSLWGRLPEALGANCPQEPRRFPRPCQHTKVSILPSSLSGTAEERKEGRVILCVALKPPSIFCRLSRTWLSVGWVIKSAVPLREESVAMFKSRLLPLKG